MKYSLLLEGPVGHMAHPYENLTLSFAQLKELFKVIVDGFPDLEVTEKLDGQNIIITFDHDTGKSLVIRRMGEHAAMGGIDKEAVRNFFTKDKVEKARRIALNKGASDEEAEKQSKGAGIPHVASAFYDAMVEFEKVAKDMPREFFRTEDGCAIFYNGEVIDPRSRNIVDYDTQDLVLHRTKHSKLCPGEKKLSSMPDEESQQYSAFLEKHLQMFSAQDEENMPKVKVNALRNFENIIVDEEILSRANQNLDNLIATSGLSGDSTIRDYLKKVLDETIENKLEGVNGPIADRISEAVLFYVTQKKMPRLRTEIAPILELISNEQTRNTVKDFLRSNAALSEIVREAIRPIEYIVHNFAADYLKGIESLYILNHEEVVGNLKSKVGAQVTRVQSLDGEKDLNVLRRNIRKMVSHTGDISAAEALYDQNIMKIYDKINTAVEGLVFSYNGQEYKITGQFAPINQIMGLGRFARAPGKRDLDERPSPGTYEGLLREEVEDVTSDKIAIFSGGFKPPHVGHYLASRYLAEQSQANKLYILVGSSVRTSKDGSISVGPDESEYFWEKYYENAPSLNFEVVVIKIAGSPVKWVYEKMESGDFDSDQIYCGIGASQGDSEPSAPEDSRWQAMTKKYENANQVVIPMQGGAIRGSIMRELLANDDDRFFLFLPDHLNDNDKVELRSRLSKKDYLK